jgi:serine phosphatase RsbU (regulator of sigma subunit)
MPDDQLSSTERAIWQAQPHALAATATQAVKDQFGANAVELLLADYRLAFLVPVTSERQPIRTDGTPAGRAFAAQQPVLLPGDDGSFDLHLPLAVNGDRLGVLVVSLPRRPDAAEQRRLASVAVILARALKIADQGTDHYQRARRQSRLTLAAEIQWELLPGRSVLCDEYHLAGQLEPAYAIWGDNFDWSAGANHLTVSVTNGMGRGTEASLLTHLAISALRNARRSGADLVDQATLANETLHNRHVGQLHVATLLLRFDLATGRVAAIDAGSPQIHRMRGNTVDRIELEAQLPLGMFEDTQYVEQEFAVEAGDRLVIVSDGVHAALSPHGDTYGASALPAALRRARLQDPSETVRTLTRDLLDHHDASELGDDSVILCLDWTGKPAAVAKGTPGA